jgi:osmotically-inducible protein OsmY
VRAEVSDGLVTLYGVVERAYQRSCAEASVLRVPGVIGVRNEIAVRAAEAANQPALQS